MVDAIEEDGCREGLFVVVIVVVDETGDEGIVVARVVVGKVIRERTAGSEHATKECFVDEAGSFVVLLVLVILVPTFQHLRVLFVVATHNESTPPL
jgi:hypothetical protein